ncbi:MAG: hypothetical protein U0441_05195 [Polyangiaceae bacterium]
MFEPQARWWQCWGIAFVLVALLGCEGTIVNGGSAGGESSSSTATAGAGGATDSTSGTGATAGSTTGTGGTGAGGTSTGGTSTGGTGTGGTGGVPCTTPADCGVPAGCLVNTCVNQVCGTAPKANGSACDDGNACTKTDTCQSGACVGASPVTCAAPDACHDAGTCNPATGTCSNPNKADGSTCDDGNACTATDTCQSGACVGASPVICTASDACHDAGTCNPATGMCTNPNKANGSACDDGNPCTKTDACQSGLCLGTNPVICTASDACHNAGTCDPATGMCSNPNKANGSPCNDGNACTKTDVCQLGACIGTNPVTCTASNACHDVGTCNPATGVCSNPNKADGSPCNDSNACTATDTCQSGTCIGASPVVCTASDACHNAGSCIPATGACTNPIKANGTSCSDGNACTQTDTCQSGACVGGSSVNCGASDPCHVAGTCNPATGVCSNPNKADGSACNDFNACTQTDTCQSGACVGANPVTCAALDACHVAGVCAPATGCSNPNKPNGAACDDNNLCTQTDACQSGACVGANPVVCGGSQMCIGGACLDTFAPSNLDPLTCQSPGATDLIVAVGNVTTLSTDSGCDVVKTQVGAPDICVHKYAHVAIHGTLKASGARVLAIVATTDMVIDGLVDVSAQWEVNGPGHAAIYGGGYGTASGSGAPAFGTPELIPISGGSPGDDQTGGMFGCTNKGGGGGGGLELVSCGNVSISGTINAGGGGGTCSLYIGKNGGSGGAVLIEGLTVTISGGVYANGGGGGGGEVESTVEVIMITGNPGSNANLSLTPAAGASPTGGDCDGSGAPGGSGGTEQFAPGPAGSYSATCTTCAGGCGFGPCYLGCCQCRMGGAGGAVGRIRINTVSAPPTLTGSTFSPAPTTGAAALN